MSEPLPASEPGRDDRSARRRFVIICLCFVLLSLALKPMTWFAPRAEADEQIYWTLARSLHHRGVYSLQGTGAIEALRLPAFTYDRPMFHHPPLFPALLVPFAAHGNPNAAIVVPWVGHVLAIVGTALACWAWRRPQWRGSDLLLWLPVAAIAVDPLMTFCSRKLWIDSLVGGLCALALGVTAIAVEQRRMKWFLAVGTLFGLAALSKLTGLIPLLPALIWTVVQLRSDDRRNGAILSLLAPVVLLVLPWMILFRITCGAWLPHWNVFPSELAASVPHVARAAARTWHYYPVQTALVAPLALACTIRLLASLRSVDLKRTALGAAVVVVVAVAITALGMQGQGYQLRYLAPGVGGLYLLLAAQLRAVDTRRSLFPAIAAACVMYGAIQTGFYLQAVEFDEILSLPEMTWKALGATAGAGG